jgi:glycosyltransferase involved in cell wall biosynthesis
MNPVHILERLDTHDIPEGPQECRVIMVVRNELERLPWLFGYYRKLGVARFFVVDNGSTDGTLDYLKAQRDVHLFLTRASYHQSRFGGQWQQAILDNYGGEHWWLVVDADEMFVYPQSETVPLPRFCQYLDSINADGVSAYMLDMYSDVPVAEAVYRSGQPFTDVCGYFDTEYDFWPRPRHIRSYREQGLSAWRLKSGNAPLLFPAMEPVGGPRLRVFYPYYRAAGAVKVFKMKMIRNLRDKLKPFGLKLKSRVPPVLFKVPLLRGGRGILILDPHSTSAANLAPVTGALLHFKFFADFHDRVIDAVNQKQHFDGASEYLCYLKALKDDPRMSFRYDKSARYQGSSQLMELGLIKDSLPYAVWRNDPKADAAELPKAS